VDKSIWEISQFTSESSIYGSEKKNMPVQAQRSPVSLPPAPWDTQAMENVPQMENRWQGNITPGQQHFQLQEVSAFGQFKPGYSIVAQDELMRGTQNLSLYDGRNINPYQMSSPYLQQSPVPSKQVKAEDKLFKDLVDLAKSKTKATSSNAGSL
jgi:hypothetical protein